MVNTSDVIIALGIFFFESFVSSANFGIVSNPLYAKNVKNAPWNISGIFLKILVNCLVILKFKVFEIDADCGLAKFKNISTINTTVSNNEMPIFTLLVNLTSYIFINVGTNIVIIRTK